MRTTLVAAIVVGVAGSAALAERIDLFVYENSNGADVSGLDLWVDVVDRGSYAEFTFHNDSSISSFVRSIYIEKTSFSNSSLEDGAIVEPQPVGVKFINGGSPPNPAGSIRHFGGEWQGNLLAVKARSGGSNKDGIDQGEYVGLRFDYDGITFQDLLDALSGDTPAFRIAQHVQGLPYGYSVWTMNDGGRIVPLPSASAMAMVGMGLVSLRRRR